MSLTESFLLKLEKNETYVFMEKTHYIISPLFPFFQLTYTEDITGIIARLEEIEYLAKGALIRVDGVLVIATPFAMTDNKMIRQKVLCLYEALA